MLRWSANTQRRRPSCGQSGWWTRLVGSLSWLNDHSKSVLSGSRPRGPAPGWSFIITGKRCNGQGSSPRGGGQRLSINRFFCTPMHRQIYIIIVSWSFQFVIVIVVVVGSGGDKACNFVLQILMVTTTQWHQTRRTVKHIVLTSVSVTFAHTSSSHLISAGIFCLFFSMANM